MTDSNNALKLQFIETYLRDGADNIGYNTLKHELYYQGYSRWQIIGMLVEAELYGSLDNFHRKHPLMG